MMQYGKWNERRENIVVPYAGTKTIGSTPGVTVDLSGKWATVENSTMLSPVPVVQRKKE